MIETWFDTLKPGERRPADAGPWCASLSLNGHIVKIVTGKHSEEDARKAVQP